MLHSEFTDEYGEWLDGTPCPGRPSWLSLTLGELQPRPALCVRPDTPVEDVVALMNRHRESAVLVTENSKVVGIFTERDVLRRVVPRVDGLFAPVSEVMTCRPDVLTEATLLPSALRALTIGRYHHVPVIDAQGAPVAVVSMQTIVAFLADAFSSEILNAPPERESFPPERAGA